MKNWKYVLIFIFIFILWAAWGLSLVVLSEFFTLNLSWFIFNLTFSVFILSFLKTDLIEFFKTKMFYQFLNQAIFIFLVFCILGLINYLGFRFAPQYDLSTHQSFTLSAQTQKILTGLKAPLEMKFFAKKEDWTSYFSFLKLFKKFYPPTDLKFVDIEKDPLEAKEESVTESGILILQYQGRKTSFKLNDELSIVNGLIKIISDKKIRLYMTFGHREPQCDNEKTDGSSQICNELKNQNIDLSSIDLTKIKEVPLDADGVIIFSPQDSFLTPEVNRLQSYLEKGGSLFVSLSPALKEASQEELNLLLRKWGLSIDPNIVLDRLATIDGKEATIPIIDQYDKDHPLVKKFSQRTLFPVSASITLSDSLYESVAVHSLATSNPYPASWGEYDLNALALGKAEFDLKKDKKGPLTVAAVSERFGSEKGVTDTRIALVGSSLMLMNGYWNQVGNRDFILNMIHWMNHTETLISLNRPQTLESPVILSQLHLDAIFYIALLIIPFIFFATAFFVFRKRKSL